MYRLSLILIFIFLMLISCTSPVKDDLFNYINMELPPVTELEEEALGEYEKIVSNSNFSYQDLYISLRDKIIPTYTNFFQQLERISPTTEEVKNIHEYYKKGAKKHLEALIALKEGLEKRDEQKLNSVGTLLNESKEYMNTFRNQVIALAEKYNIKYKLQ